MKYPTKKTEKISLSIDSDVLAKARDLAKTRFGNNLSAVFNQAMITEIEVGRGALSKMAQYLAEVRGTFRALNLKMTEPENAVDCIIPTLKLGIEAKYRYAPGKGETAAIAAMAYTIGQNLCEEIWIVTAEAMPAEERTQWERVARDFHLCPVRVVPAAELANAIKAKARQLKAKDRGFTFDFDDDKKQ